MVETVSMNEDGAFTAVREVAKEELRYIIRENRAWKITLVRVADF
jgi:hypothetical protein